GSVKVTAGSNVLVEDVDYTVDYQMGIVRIINQGVLNSGIPINISTESNTTSMATKRLLGLRIEHVFSKNLYVGATIVNLHQNPVMKKVNYGEEPISNTIYGFDAAYDKESRYLTKAVDAILPFSSSKTPSRINLYAEFAHFIPGYSKVISKEGTTYLDDFEGTKTTINLKEPYSWYIASTPQYQPDLFIESSPAFASTRISGMNRAKLAWYTIDPIFYGNSRPKNVSKEDMSQPYSRPVEIAEVFPNKELSTGESSKMSILNLAFYPSERGLYNYDVKPVAGITAGINAEGKLNNPETRWGGIMRKIDNTDFEASNVEYIEFWVMDPFIGTDGKDGNP
ncbi:MAG: cell surface protein SprA, partial [Bacteroidales bacterium]